MELGISGEYLQGIMKRSSVVQGGGRRPFCELIDPPPPRLILMRHGVVRIHRIAILLCCAFRFQVVVIVFVCRGAIPNLNDISNCVFRFQVVVIVLLPGPHFESD